MTIRPCTDCLELPDGPMCRGPDGKRDFARLAHGYLKHDHLDAVPYATAFDCVFSLECEEPEEALAFLLAAHALVANEEERACLAAGPLEHLLVRHGPLVVDRIVEKARQEPLFRRCLSSVWGRDAMAPDVVARIDAVLKPAD